MFKVTPMCTSFTLFCLEMLLVQYQYIISILIFLNVHACICSSTIITLLQLSVTFCICEYTSSLKETIKPSSMIYYFIPACHHIMKMHCEKIMSKIKIWRLEQVRSKIKRKHKTVKKLKLYNSKTKCLKI